MSDLKSWFNEPTYLAAVFCGSYLLGSIPFGLLLTKLFGVGDIRQIGSGNIGATNVLRTGKKILALSTLLLDGLKGATAVYVTFLFNPNLILVAALTVVFGHIFPLWLKFKGGKGVATTIGVFICFQPILGLSTCLTWLLVAFIFRYSSLASLIAVGLSPIYAWCMEFEDLVLVTSILAVFIWSTHKRNICRILTGMEPKI